MRKLFILFSICFLFSCKTSRVDYVNPLIGTSGEHPTQYGGTIPGIGTPFGMTQWSAMTRFNNISRCPYHYNDKKIIGFIGTHQPTIWMGDYGQISFMPLCGKLKITEHERGLPFQHNKETSTPYYYSVYMQLPDKKNIRTEITATCRSGMFRIKYPQHDSIGLIFDICRDSHFNGYIKIIPESNEIIAYNTTIQSFRISPKLNNFKGWYVFKFNKKIKHFGVILDSANEYHTKKDIKILPGIQEFSFPILSAYIYFENSNTGPLLIKTGSSFISAEQARENLSAEIPEWDFNQTKNTLKKNWEEQLGRVEISGGTKEQKTIFYTALYHCFQYPRIFSEYNRYYSAFDDTIHNGISYNDYSLWDTYRALHPLLTFLAPEHVSPMMQSLLQMYKEGGWLPKWPNPTYTNIMIGTHADAVLADAIMKNFSGFDYALAYEAMYKNGMVPPDNDTANRWRDRAPWTSYEARGGLTWYKQNGYVAADKTDESVSNTLEFAFDDYCLAQVAKKLGKKEDYQYFLKRSRNYQNVYNPVAGFMQPRLSDGSFFTGHPGIYKAFTEGSPWTYLFAVQHDVYGLINLMGIKKFTDRLNENFEQNYYQHNNEPGHHYIYLYNYLGQPNKTRELLKKHIQLNYKNTPDGLSGNDDCGQMSAWLVFSSIGFYPVAPASNQYATGAPQFKKIKIHLKPPLKEKTITINTLNYSVKNIYVKSIRLDGKKIEQPFLQHQDILNANNIIFEMTNNPAECLGLIKK